METPHQSSPPQETRPAEIVQSPAAQDGSAGRAALPDGQLRAVGTEVLGKATGQSGEIGAAAVEGPHPHLPVSELSPGIDSCRKLRQERANLSTRIDMGRDPNGWPWVWPTGSTRSANAVSLVASTETTFETQERVYASVRGLAGSPSQSGRCMSG